MQSFKDVLRVVGQQNIEKPKTQSDFFVSVASLEENIVRQRRLLGQRTSFRETTNQVEVSYMDIVLGVQEHMVQLRDFLNTYQHESPPWKLTLTHGPAAYEDGITKGNESGISHQWYEGFILAREIPSASLRSSRRAQRLKEYFFLGRISTGARDQDGFRIYNSPQATSFTITNGVGIVEDDKQPIITGDALKDRGYAIVLPNAEIREYGVQNKEWQQEALEAFEHELATQAAQRIIDYPVLYTDSSSGLTDNTNAN